MLPTTSDLYRVILPGAVGAGMALLTITSLFPKHGTVAGALWAVGGGLMAGTAPPLTLAQEIGMGAFVAAGTWLTLRALNEIPLPATPAGAAVLPPVTLPDGTTVTFGRRAAA